MFDETIDVLHAITALYYSATGAGRFQDKLTSHFISTLYTILGSNTCPLQKTKSTKASSHLVEVQLAAADTLRAVTQYAPPSLRGPILAGLYPLLSAGGGIVGVYSATTCATMCTQLAAEVEQLLTLNLYGHNSHQQTTTYSKFTPLAMALLTCMWVLQAAVHHITSSTSEDENTSELQIPESMRSVRSFCLSFFSGLLQVVINIYSH